MSAYDNEEALDTNLCYLALGVSVSDPPHRIRETYERLVRKCKAEFSSSDPDVRESAREQLLTIEAMYKRIAESVSYASMASEHGKREAARGNEATAAPLRRITCDLTICPACNAQISKGMPSCPFCKKSLLTKWQKFRRRYLTVTNLLSFLIAVMIAVLTAALVRNNFMR